MPRLKYVKVRVPDPVVPDTEDSHYYRLIAVHPDVARRLHRSPTTVDADIAWSRSHFNHMREDGGIWAVPRSGLVFTRRGDELVLTARMPWTPELEAAARAGQDVPKSAAELASYQDMEYETIRDRFERAGIKVRKGETDGD